MLTAIASQIGPYRLKRQIGSGGFGKVFLAEHTTKQTQVALKVLHTFSDDDEEEKEAYAEAVAAFQQEFRILQQMQHTHIVHVLDGQLEGETPYVAMEYCSYGAFARRYPLGVIFPLALIVSRVRQIASALHYAHELGVIHRDVKPQNMLFGVNEEILLSDFGLAALTHKGDGNPDNPYRFSGTLYYMAPEQFFGSPVPNSDQYALGVTVYNWLNGNFPFYGSTHQFAAYFQGATPPIPLGNQVPDLPAGIEAVIMRALAINPDERYPNVMAFADALEEASQIKADFYALPIGWDQEANARRWADQALVLHDAKRYEEAKEACSRALALNPRFYEAYAHRALIKYELKDYTAALEDLNHVIELAPDLQVAYKCRALVFHKLEQFEQAIADQTHILERDDADAVMYNNRGYAYQRLEQFQAALADFQQAVTLFPRFALAYANRAGVYRELGEFQEAQDNIQQALELEPTLVLAYNEQAMLLHKLGRHEEALASIKRAQEINPHDTQTWVALGGITYDLEEYEQARVAFTRALELHPTSADGWYLLGCISIKLEDYPRALEELLQAVKVRPTYTRAYHERALLLYTMQQYEQALMEFEKAFALDPTNAKYWSEFTSLLLKLRGNDLVRDMLLRVIQRHPTLSEAWFQLASCSAYNDRFVSAHQQYSRALKFNPHNAFAYAMRALCNLEMKHYNSALVDCRRASALDPEHYLPWQARGNVFLAIGQNGRAYQAFNQLIERNPDDAANWQKRALASYQAHNYAQAIADCTRALTLDDQLTEAYLTRAQSQRELTHLTDAVADYQTYLAASSEDTDAWRQLGQVYDILGDSEHAQAAYQQAEQLSKGK